MLFWCEPKQKPKQVPPPLSLPVQVEKEGKEIGASTGENNEGVTDSIVR